MGILVALIVLSILILIHELGHFLVARLWASRSWSFPFSGAQAFSVKGVKQSIPCG